MYILLTTDMTPIFTTPLALLGLLAIPALILIYILRTRFRRHTVSSLMLWMNQRPANEGGLLVERFNAPILFFLELIVILMIVLAAAGPKIPAGVNLRPLVIILDDSYSMLAGGDASPRAKALEAIDSELAGRIHNRVYLMLAGPSPLLLGDPPLEPRQVRDYLDEWDCKSADSNIDAAIAFAIEVAGDRAHVLVLTDHKPAQPPEEGRVQWLAFGSSRSNVAFTNASRNLQHGKDRVFLEIANLSSQQTRKALIVQQGDPPREIQRSNLELASREQRRLTLRIDGDESPIHVRLDSDALEIDNEVILLREGDKKIKYDNRISDEGLKSLVDKALASTGRGMPETEHPDLILSDSDVAGDTPPGVWLVQLISEKDAKPFIGPFVLDNSNPLTEGLALNGVIWSAGSNGQAQGRPVITAGNIPLISDQSMSLGRRNIRIRFRPESSTLQNTPNWPILFWNLLNWRAENSPGIKYPNVKLGSDAILITRPGTEALEVTAPDSSSHKLTAYGDALRINARDIGLYKVRAGGQEYLFASNTLRYEESDLSTCAQGRWGNWFDSATVQSEYRNIAWLPLLVAMIALCIHAALVVRKMGVKRV